MGGWGVLVYQCMGGMSVFRLHRIVYSRTSIQPVVQAGAAVSFCLVCIIIAVSAGCVFLASYHSQDDQTIIFDNDHDIGT